MLQRRPNTFAQTTLSPSFFACDKAAEHTFRIADYAGATLRGADDRLRKVASLRFYLVITTPEGWHPNCASGVGAGIRQFSGSPGRRWVLSTFNYETAYFRPSTRYRSERVRW
jgi:hypothetical protein